jgi:regulatory protein
MSSPDSETFKRQALTAALEMIARRDHTVREVERKLRAKGFGPAACRAALERCRDLGYLDDARTAKAMVDSLRRRGLGVHRIRAQLRDKGVAAPVIAELTDQDDDPSQALAAARAACDRRRAHFERESDPARRRAKIYRFLLSRGFEADIIHRLLAQD